MCGARCAIITAVASVQAGTLPALPDAVGLAMAPVARFQGRASYFMVEGPKVLLPSSQEIKRMNPADRNYRLHYFVSVFMLLYLVILTAGSAVMVLRPILKWRINRAFPYHGLGERAAPGLTVGFQRVLVAVAFSLTVAACTAACLFAMQTGTLSKVSGLDWELYAILLALGGMSLLLQCLFAVCWLPVNERFGCFTFAEATFTGLTPFVSDAFDTLKDTIFAALCLESEHMMLKVIGVISWLYLLAIHVFLVGRVNTLAELAAAYLPVLMAPPRAKPTDANGESSCIKVWNIVLLSMYKQATPTKRELLLWENVPQALLSIVYLYLEGGSRFIATINVAIPAAQVVATFFVFPIMLECIAPMLAKKLLLFMQHGNYARAEKVFSEAFQEEGDLQLFIAALPILHDEPLINDLMTRLDITWKDIESHREMLPSVRTGLAAMIKCEGDLERVNMAVEALQAAEAAKFPTIFEAAQSIFGLGATRHFLRKQQGLVQQTQGVPRFSALHCAAGGGFGATCQVLLAARAEIDARTLDGETPLHWAAEKGHPEAVKCLLEWKASMVAKNGSGNTPLGEAKINHHNDVVDILEAEEQLEETRKAREARQAWEESPRDEQKEADEASWHPSGGWKDVGSGLKLKEKLFGHFSG